MLGRHPAIDLAGRSGAEVIAAPEIGVPRGEGVGARRERLRFQRLDFREEIGGQLARHYPEQILLEVRAVDHGHPVAAAGYGQGTAVRIALPLDESALGGGGGQGHPGGEPDGRAAEGTDHQGFADRGRNPEGPGLGEAGPAQARALRFGRRPRREDREIAAGLRVATDTDAGTVGTLLAIRRGDLAGAGLVAEGAQREDGFPGSRLGSDERLGGFDGQFAGAQDKGGRCGDAGCGDRVGEADPDLAGDGGLCEGRGGREDRQAQQIGSGGGADAGTRRSCGARGSRALGHQCWFRASARCRPEVGAPTGEVRFRSAPRDGRRSADRRSFVASGTLVSPAC